MVFLRFLGIVFMVLALMLLGADIIASLEKSEFVMRSLTQVLALIDSDPTNWFDTTLPSAVASVMKTIFSWPAWVVLALPGLLIVLLTRGRGDTRLSGELD